MKMIGRAAACMLAAAICVPLGAGAQENGAIASSALAALKVSHAPGLSLAVMEHGKIAFARGFGVKNFDLQTPVDPHTRFEIGSITKQFTAAAILQLKEHGKLSLSDRLGKYVPQYATGKNVTIEQLLWQVSGVPDYTEAKRFMRTAASQPGSLDGVLRLIKGKPLAFAPGTKWAYSNTNYYLLGRVVEVASGTPWQTYVRTYIFAPANMTESTFIEDERNASDMATGYELKKQNFVPSPPVGAWAYSAGAIVSTAGDLLKWDRAVFAGKIVSAADFKLMTTPGRLRSGKSTGYGFGWVIDKHDGVSRIWHNGGTFGFVAQNEIYPSLGEAIVALENSSAAGPALVAARAFAAINPQLASAEAKSAKGEDPAITARAKGVWQMFASGNVDRSQLDARMNKAMTPQMLSAVAERFKPLGDPQTWVYRGKQTVQDDATYDYLVTFSSGIKLDVTMTLDKDGKIAGFFARAA